MLLRMATGSEEAFCKKEKNIFKLCKKEKTVAEVFYSVYSHI